MNEALNQKLRAIGVRTEMSSGNIAPLLHEVRHALRALAEEGSSTILDLKSIPLLEGEQDKILNFLGSGEVHVELRTLGKSEIYETSYPGVWIVTHYDEEGDLRTRFIEVTHIPGVLLAQKEDIDDGVQRMESALRT